jgi:DNA-directed RNA polymerase
LAYIGGSYIAPLTFIHTNGNDHTNTLENPISPLTLRAVNVVQHTAWAINGWLLDVVAEAWTDGSTIAGLPSAWGLPRPDPIPEAIWKTMDTTARREWKAKLAELHGQNVRDEGRRNYLLDCLSSGRELRNEPAIWFPHFLDFRGRMYPVSHRGPHPQASDLGKALIHFARGKELGPTGLRWLSVRAANTYGKDKLPLDERVAWVTENLALIEDSARDPLGGEKFWAEAAEPWSFLATCRELHLALGEENPDRFVSHLPIPMDGSCNGLQHLSAMGRDPVGALATNLTSSPERHDIYQQVADAVMQTVSRDASLDVAEATAWVGNVTRNTVKRAVMTTPYGVTAMGIRDQLIADGMVPKSDVGRSPMANYMRACIVDALGRTVASAKQIMAWLQESASVLAKAGQPFEWTTPAGTRIRQGYRRKITREVATLQGKVLIADASAEAGIDQSRAVLASAPNVVHSFDAAHLQMTVADLHDNHGIASFAMVHDSYGTHACDTPRMHESLREQFVSIYRDDRLAMLHAELRAQHPGVPLPPAIGSFDVSQVRDSQFFFA